MFLAKDEHEAVKPISPNHRRGFVLPSKKAHRREAVFEQRLIKRGVKPKGNQTARSSRSDSHGVVCRRLGRQRRQHRRHAPHHITLLEGLRSSPQMPPAFSHLRHQGTRTRSPRQPRHGRHGWNVLSRKAWYKPHPSGMGGMY